MDRCLNLLGLAKKAGSLEIGEECVSASVARVKARCILSASDASDGSKRKAGFMAEDASVPHVVLPYTKQELSLAVGRGAPGVLAITDTGLAASFTAALSEAYEGYGEAAERMALKKQRAQERKAAAGRGGRPKRSGGKGR